MRLGSTCDSAGLFMCLQASVYAKPMAARAHQPAQKMPVVGFLNGGSAGPFAQYVAASPRTVCPKTWWHGFEETDHRHRRTGAPPPEKNIEEHLLEIRLCFEITSPALYPLQRLEKAKQSLVHRYVGTGN